MRAPKLTAILFSLVILVFVSCSKDSKVGNIYTGDYLPMTGAQETPAVTTTAAGNISADYNKLTKLLNYRITFTGLSANASAAHIHGLGEAGTSAPVVQTFSSFPAAKAGTYTGSLFADGVKIKEDDILAGRYYVNIHNASFPAGEIRGQIILTKK